MEELKVLLGCILKLVVLFNFDMCEVYCFWCLSEVF